LNNPNIARVVQYQTLYQIFQNANIKAYKDYYYRNEDTNINHNYNVLYQYGLQIIEKISFLSDDDIKNISLEIALYNNNKSKYMTKIERYKTQV
jgi:hypothetical protein